MNKLIFLILVVALIAPSLCIDPPTYNYSFHITFDDTFIVDGKNYQVNGQKFYDPVNNRERVDRANGRYDTFCSGVLPNISTPCSHYTVSDKRWIVFPQKTQCCFCCDSAHGCGILKPDWLKAATFMGEEKIIDTVYDKWNQDGMFGYNYFYAAQDADKTPRRIDQGGKHITDYSVHSFRKQTFPESIFALPQYCNTQTPTNCPLESICGKLRQTKTQ